MFLDFLLSRICPSYLYSLGQVSCGQCHSAAVTDDGKLFTWGNSSYGRLGHGDREDQLKPKLVSGLLRKILGEYLKMVFMDIEAVYDIMLLLYVLYTMHTL